MPSYYFHLRDKGELILDSEGLKLPDIASARDECRKIVRAVLDEEKWRSEIRPDRQFEIVDDSGRTVLVVPFEHTKAVTRPVNLSTARRR